jgi:hypothetical protein
LKRSIVTKEEKYEKQEKKKMFSGYGLGAWYFIEVISQLCSEADITIPI